ncbi:MAG: hypothetical protein OHK93_001257 [Ramalina farinacea]|uniref:Uncharacterized protein n=1 Tax=Ramalina farinacea TaxID=258253 RepID=A0AA43QSG6_9LECA|nr:hypothetical protein [Ramalina farinacea]
MAAPAGRSLASNPWSPPLHRDPSFVQQSNSTHLIQFISKYDPLPADWDLTGRRHSVEQMPSLRAHLEVQHGIWRQRAYLKRRSSAPEGFTNARIKAPTSFRGRCRQRWQQFTQIISKRGGSGQRWPPFTQVVSNRGRSEPRWQQFAQVVSSKAHGVSMMIANTYRSSSCIWMRQSPTPFPKLVLFLGEIFSLAWAIFCISCSFLERLYRVCKRPLAYLVAWLLCVIILLNVFATGYTICTVSFLDTFCPKQLPLLRNFICSRWDGAQTAHKNLSAVDSSAVDSTVQPPYARYLQDEDSSFSYKLPHALSLWEQAIRSFRASVAESEYPVWEQERFHQEFTDYIEQSMRATSTAHHFYAHMIGTINHHTSNTRWLLQKLRAEGPMDNITLHVSGPLAQSMEMLNTYGMVYLPKGLQPFQQNVGHRPLDAASLMRSYVGDMIRRLEEDIMMINALQQSLNELAVASNNINTHSSQLWAENQRAAVAIKPQWWQLFSNTLQYRLDRYTIDQQALWLGELRDGVWSYSEKLRMIAGEFEAATVACHNFQERLVWEGEATDTAWIEKQAGDLEGGFTDLRLHFQNFKEEKIRFDKAVFRL